MDVFIDMVLDNLSAINWEGPSIFVIILFAFLAIFKKWGILLITILTIVLGWGAQDLIISNIETKAGVTSVPLIIYCIGGGIILILILITFFKSSID